MLLFIVLTYCTHLRLEFGGSKRAQTLEVNGLSGCTALILKGLDIRVIYPNTSVSGDIKKVLDKYCP